MLATAGTTLAWLSASGLGSKGESDAQGLPMLKNMGGEGPGFANRNRAGGFDILEHCHGLGLGVVRLNVPQGGLDAARAVRKRLDAYGMRSIVSVAPPRTDAAVAAYDAAIAAAREMGAVTTHASFTHGATRSSRTSEFKPLSKPQSSRARRAHFAQTQIRLAIENHKGWRSAELLRGSTVG